jgi:hypothetical protein
VEGGRVLVLRRSGVALEAVAVLVVDETAMERKVCVE